MIDHVREAKLLGVIISDDLSWQANTTYLVKRAYKRMFIIRKLNEFKINRKDMLTIYVLFIRVVIEQSSVVWSSSVTLEELDSLERTQKVAFRLIFQRDYLCYENALSLSGLPSIKNRYNTLLLNFALKCTKSESTKDILPLAPTKQWARKQEKFHVPLARKQRFFKSAVPTMARLLNAKT